MRSKHSRTQSSPASPPTRAYQPSSPPSKKTDTGIGIVTDAYEYAATARLRHTGLDTYFDTVVAYDKTGYKKTHHAPFECAMDPMNVTPSQTMYIGDSIRRDIEPAKALGLATVYAAYGDRNFFEHNRICPATGDHRKTPGRHWKNALIRLNKKRLLILRHITAGDNLGKHLGKTG